VVGLNDHHKNNNINNNNNMKTILSYRFGTLNFRSSQEEDQKEHAYACPDAMIKMYTKEWVVYEHV